MFFVHLFCVKLRNSSGCDFPAFCLYICVYKMIVRSVFPSVLCADDFVGLLNGECVLLRINLFLLLLFVAVSWDMLKVSALLLWYCAIF